MNKISFLGIITLITFMIFFSNCKKSESDSISNDSMSDTHIDTMVWSNLSTGTTKNLQSIYFINKNIGYAVGNSGTIIKTNNGGTNWKSVSPFKNADINLFGVYFLNKDTGYTAGSGNLIIKTTDGGVNWDTVYYTGVWEYFEDICFINEDIGYAVGVYTLVKTINGGKDWTIQNNSPHGNKVKFLSSQEGYILSSSNISYTKNGGVTWQSINMSDSYSFEIVSSQKFYIGSTSIIYKTTNGGVNFSQKTNFDGSIVGIKFPAENVGYAVTYSQNIYCTSDGGENWKLTRKGTMADFGVNSMYFVEAGYGFITCDYGIIKKGTFAQ
jgi:photosystem II stability/assembly factor-like uncharacterized protein